MHTEHNSLLVPDHPAILHREELLDEALANSFPASDPLSSLMTDEPPAQETTAC
jgi:hypothetical protein